MRALVIPITALALAAPAAWAQGGAVPPGGAAPPRGQPAPSGGSPSSPLPPAAPPQQTAPQTPTTPSTPTSSDDSGPSKLGALGLFGAGVVVILVIGWVIMRDARRSLPERARRRRRGKAKPARGKA